MKGARTKPKLNRPVQLKSKAEKALAFRSLKDAKQGLLRMLERARPVQQQKVDR